MSSYLTQQQIDKILSPINPNRVSSRDGQSYVQAYEVKAQMARIFGVARWSSRVVEMVCLFEDAVQTKAGKPAWHVAYRAGVEVIVNAPDGTYLATYTEYHAGGSTHPDKGEAHGGAITNAESYAFKRAATMALLDQGGLSLYGKGSLKPLVFQTLHYPFGDAPRSVSEPEGQVQEEQDTDSFGLAEPPLDQRVTSQKPPPRSAEQIAADAEAGAPKGAKHHQFYARLSLEVITAGLKDAPSPIEDMSLKQFVDYQEEAHRG